MAAAAKHLTPVLLELGGKSPVVVDSGTNLKVRSIFLGIAKSALEIRLMNMYLFLLW